MVTKHTKPSAANQQGGIVNKEAYIDISNVMYRRQDGKATRVGFKLDGDKKVRCCQGHRRSDRLILREEAAQVE